MFKYYVNVVINKITSRFLKIPKKYIANDKYWKPCYIKAAAVRVTVTV